MPQNKKITPPACPANSILHTIQEDGFAVANANTVALEGNTSLDALNALLESWNELSQDQHLKDAGNYRKRKHSSYTIEHQQAQLQPHRAHWQPLDYNALHGGMERWFDPIDPHIAQSKGIHGLLCWLNRLADGMHGEQKWFAEVHQFRIEATSGIGRPTPEGAHRDGVHLVAVFVLNRHNILGGETRVFHINNRFGQRFTIEQPWSVLLLDDQRVIHESTPIQPDTKAPAWRDTLVITLRANGFQSPDTNSPASS